MKKYLLPLCAALLAATSCSKIDTQQDMNEYTDCIVYSADTQTGTGCLSDYASIKVTGDMATQYYALDFNDFQFYQGDRLRSARVGNLVQFVQDKTDDNGNLEDIYYFFFKQQQNTSVSGDFSVKDMRMGWLSTIYWLSFTSDDGRYQVWSLPRRVQMYANRNFIRGPHGNNDENAISPRYDMSFDVANSTVTIKGSGVKYPVDQTEPSKSLDFRQVTWPDLPAEFNDKGFTINVDEFIPTVNGSTDDYVITNFKASFEANYEGKRECSFSLTSRKTGLKLYVTSTFDYYMGQRS